MSVRRTDIEESTNEETGTCQNWPVLAVLRWPFSVHREGPIAQLKYLLSKIILSGVNLNGMMR